MEELANRRAEDETKRFQMTLNSAEVASDIIKSSFKCRMISERPYKLFYDPPAELVNEQNSQKKPMTKREEKPKEDFKIERNVLKREEIKEPSQESKQPYEARDYKDKGKAFSGYNSYKRDDYMQKYKEKTAEPSHDASSQGNAERPKFFKKGAKPEV